MNTLALIPILLVLSQYSTAFAANINDPGRLRGAADDADAAAPSDTHPENLRALGSPSKSQTTRFEEFKLTPQNEKSPFKGVDNAAGSAIVTLNFNPSRSKKYQVCIRTKVFGFVPGLLHIHNGKISENGAAVIDYSDLLSSNDNEFYGCMTVTKDLFEDIKANPVRHSAISAHESTIAAWIMMAMMMISSSSSSLCLDVCVGHRDLLLLLTKLP